VRRGVARVLYRTVVQIDGKWAKLPYFGFGIGNLSIVIELFLQSYGPACVGSLSELALAKFL
jgi:hypothetical protein